MTSSGRVAPVTVGDTVLLVEDVRYRVQKLFPADGTVVLQKIKTRDRPFEHFVSQICVPSPAMVDAAADPAFHSICDCPDREPLVSCLTCRTVQPKSKWRHLLLTIRGVR